MIKIFLTRTRYAHQSSIRRTTINSRILRVSSSSLINLLAEAQLDKKEDKEEEAETNHNDLIKNPNDNHNDLIKNPNDNHN